MDDDLELPTANATVNIVDTQDNDNQSSEEDDGGPDWTKLLSSSSKKAFIPKRGEKEYEPTGEKGTGLQQHKLERVRAAMFNALDVQRTISSKAVSYSIWYPGLSRCVVTIARGTLFNSIGHNAPRPVLVPRTDSKDEFEEKMLKRLELLPEEALYMIERGSMFCWKRDGVDPSILKGTEMLDGAPMSVQQAYAEMIGTESLTLERYQVFTYLKRLGYVVTRTQPPSPFYNTPPPLIKHERNTKNPLRKIIEFLLFPFRGLYTRTRDYWKPLNTGLLHRYLSYSSIFASLRFIPSGHSLPLCSPPSRKDPEAIESPYKLFYNVYKPSTSFRKTAPPPPDFSVVVVDGKVTMMPSLHELSALFNELPEIPLPLPRKRVTTDAAIVSETHNDLVNVTSCSSWLNTLSRFAWPIYYLLSVLTYKRIAGIHVHNKPIKPNPFQALKAGKKTVVVAAVDSGIISFFRFSQGAFEEWPMV